MNIIIKVSGYKCKRCGYKWMSKKRNPLSSPKVCPKCNSPYWNKPKQNEIKNKLWNKYIV